MFRGSSTHPQEVNVVNCTYMQPLVLSFSAGGRLVHLLRVTQVGINKGTCTSVYTVVYGVCACISLIKGNKKIKMLGVSNYKKI